MSIFNFVKALLPRVEKTDVLEDLRITKSEMNEVLIPTYSSAESTFAGVKFKSEGNKNLEKVFYASLDGKRSVVSNFILEIARRLDNVRANVDYLEQVCDKEFEADLLNGGMSARNSIILRGISSIVFINKYAINLLNLVISNEAIEAGADSDIEVPGAMEKWIISNTTKFSQLLSDYSIDSKKFKDIIGKIPNVVVNEDNAKVVNDLYPGSKLDPFKSGYTNNFTYNPIYHIRLYIAEYQTKRYKAAQEKKKILELRLMHLKMVQDGNNDPKIEKEIRYTQDRVDKLDKYLLDVDKDLNIGRD